MLAAGRDGPGLELLDVSAAGEGVGFREVGAGAELLPRFRLDPGVAVVLSLVYRVEDCTAVPAEPFPLTVRLRAGGAEGVVEVPLPRSPSDRTDAAPGQEDEWQTVLARELCTS